MNHPISSKIKTNYENFIAVCPFCEHENIYNRVTDLKTTETISCKKVNCYQCNNYFYINGDPIGEAYEYILLDTYELKEQKRYMYCILNLAQSLELFLSYCIRVKLLFEPFKKGVLESCEDFNSTWNNLKIKFNRDTFCYLKNAFFELYLNSYIFLNRSEINGFINNYNEYKKREPSDLVINNHPDSNLADLFLRLKKTEVSQKRNQVVHKYSYRPTLKEVEECLKQTRDIVFKLKYHLKIRDHIYYLNNRNISY